MKKHLLLFTLCFIAITQAFAYTTVTVQDSISSDTHWTNDKQYFLKGWVYVTDGATLTIDAGVIIKGDHDSKGTLIIERGAKIMANGTVDQPIVFTSNEAPGNRNYGDWGGLMICGRAPNNWNGGDAQVEGGPRSHYGGNDPHDNSGKLSFVRIEFAGIALSPNNEVNGLTLCSVGDATQIDHVQISYSGDDAVEWFGGNVNAKYLVAYRSWDDDFDNDNGWQGKVQFGVILRDPNVGDVSGSKGWESDSYQSGTDTVRLTKPVFSNITAVGPLLNPTTTQYATAIRAGVHIRRGSAMSLVNSIVGAWPCGVLLDEAAPQYTTTSGNIGTDELQFRHNIIAGTGTQDGFARDILYVKDGARSMTAINANADTTGGTPVPRFQPFSGPWDFLLNPAYGNKIYANFSTNVNLANPFSTTNPSLIPLTISPVCYNSHGHPFNTANPINLDTSNNYANYNAPDVPPGFADNKANDAFFDQVNYIGAFAGTQLSSADWTKVWVDWDPQNTNYDHVNTGVKSAKVFNISLAEVFPNPANQSATVSFNINETSNVQVSMLDMTGKVVAELFNGNNVSGNQVINIDLSKFNAGLYFVSINSNNGNKTLKLSVIK